MKEFKVTICIHSNEFDEHVLKEIIEQSIHNELSCEFPIVRIDQVNEV